MRTFAVTTCFALFVSAASVASAQLSKAGDIDLDGRVLLKIVVGTKDPPVLVQRATNLPVTIVSEKGERAEVRTDDAGVALAWLIAGAYRISSEPLVWEGKSYKWDMTVHVMPGMDAVRWTRENAVGAPPVAAPAVLQPRPAVSAPAAGAQVTPATVAAATSPPAAPPAAPPVAQPAAPPPTTTAVAVTPQPVAPPPPAPRAIPKAQAVPAKIPDGFWANASVGYGRMGCYLCDGIFNGISGGVSAGARIRPRVLFGVGASGFTRSDNGLTRTVGIVDGRFRFYANEQGGFFLTAGLGMGFIGADVSGLGSDSHYGFGGLFGFGKDFGVAAHVAVTPFANVIAIRTSNSDATFGQLGVGLTFH